MKKNLFWLLIISPFYLAAQGINFEHDQTWEAVLQKAKAAKKNVFVDCYATWCGPCKLMDKMVYSNDTVANYMNANFISIRLQMDSTKEDNEDGRRWYSIAHEFAEKYHVTVFPTFLYFSSEGRPLHKDIGFKGLTQFMAMGHAAVDPQQQFYELLAAYEHGGKNYKVLAYLANTAWHLREDAIADSVATDYMKYLVATPWEERWTKDNLTFIAKFANLVTSHDNLFQLYYHDGKRIDSIMDNPGYSDWLVNNTIYKEEVKEIVDAGIKSREEPDWGKLERKIKGKYNKRFAVINILRGRVIYYRGIKYWAKYAKYFVQRMDQANIDGWKAGPSTATVLNDGAFEVFKYSNNKRELKKALDWVDRSLAMKSNPDAYTLDTKANILYKLGKKDEGLALEERSHKLDPRDQEITESFEKMKNGLPTWPND